jgi:hypothetical protein
MKKHGFAGCFVFMTACFVGIATLAHAEPTPAENQSTNLPIRQISGDIFEIGKVRFDKKQRTAQFDARVNMSTGFVEYLLVSTSGKLHESIFQTEIEPYHLHTAMLLLGAQVGPQKALPGEPIDIFEGDPVTIRVGYKSGGRNLEIPAEDWVFNKNTAQPMERGNWIYTGSRIIDGTFLAQRDRSIVSIITDPFALINNPRKGHEDDAIWSAHSPRIPPIDTPVVITIQIQAPPKSGVAEKN